MQNLTAAIFAAAIVLAASVCFEASAQEAEPVRVSTPIASPNFAPEHLPVLNRKWSVQKNAIRSVPPSRRNSSTNPRDLYRSRQVESPSRAADGRVHTSEALGPSYQVVPMLYNYRIEVLNRAAKSIRRIEWEYVFFTADSNPGSDAKPLGVRWFETQVSISPGETVDISEHTTSAPEMVVDVSRLGRKDPPKYREQIRILSIEYRDGSEWRAEPNRTPLAQTK